MEHPRVPGKYIFLINQIFEIEQKTQRLDAPNSIHRNLDRLKAFFEQELQDEGLSLSYHSPLGERYDETRTDCQASIAGAGLDGLVITQVVKPIIRLRAQGQTFIVQKAVVVARQAGT